jgi:hypothetical protein
MVGETGFEPATLCSQSRCATRLRYSPPVEKYVVSNGLAIHANGNKTPILDRQIHIPIATPVCFGVAMGKKYDQLDLDEH